MASRLININGFVTKRFISLLSHLHYCILTFLSSSSSIQHNVRLLILPNNCFKCDEVKLKSFSFLSPIFLFILMKNVVHKWTHFVRMFQLFLFTTFAATPAFSVSKFVSEKFFILPTFYREKSTNWNFKIKKKLKVILTIFLGVFFNRKWVEWNRNFFFWEWRKSILMS